MCTIRDYREAGIYSENNEENTKAYCQIKCETDAHQLYSQRRESESEGEKANTETKKKDLYKLYSAKTKINILKGYQLVISHKTPLFTCPTCHHPRFFPSVHRCIGTVKSNSLESTRVII